MKTTYEEQQREIRRLKWAIAADICGIVSAVAVFAVAFYLLWCITPKLI